MRRRCCLGTCLIRLTSTGTRSSCWSARATLEFDNDGKPERVGPGGVMFAASNVMHGLKNVGETTANYFVIAIGRDSVVQPV